MATATPAAEILVANQAYARFLGYTRAELAGKSVYDLTHPDDRERTRSFFDDVAQDRRREFSYEKRYRRKNGEIVWGLVTTTWLFVHRDTPAFCVGIVQDITANKAADAQLKQSEGLYRSLVENIDLGLNLIDNNHRILKVNTTVARWYNQNPEHFVGKKCFEELESRDSVCQHCPGTRVLRDGKIHHVETEGVRADGSRFLVRLRAMPVPDPDGTVRTFIKVVEDLTRANAAEVRLRKNQDRLNYLAHHDQLTGLPNRTLLYDRLKHALDRADRKKEGMAVVLFDLDRFQKISNILGHAVGNQTLKQAAERLVAQLRKSDSLCLAGENDFAMILERCRDLKKSTSSAQRILEILSARPFSVEGNELHLSASVGISHFPEDGHEVETLLRAARVARSRVREQGGDGYQFYRPEMENNSKKLLLLENLLYKALQEDQLLVYYQPQVNPASGQIIGMEALVRWKHPERGLVSPAEFIPLAEESGLIIALGRSVLLKACRQAKKWLDAGLLPFRVAVNVSPRQLVKGDLLKTIRDCLGQTDLSPAFLEVEITESALMQNPQHALSILQALKGLGVRVALDDFGTGYSSLVYLKNFPIDRLKIAQDFIRNVPAVSKDAAIVQSIFALGRELGIAVIAEGVETKEQLEFLLGLGCSEVQGYYFAKPLDAKTVTGYLKKWFGPNPTCPLRL
jgi:diguanylate cyclase (GGDEF)-like protein/PAS domain S-box-containing protein